MAVVLCITAMADEATRDHLALKVGAHRERNGEACIGGMLILAGRESKASASLELANTRGMVMTRGQTVSRCRMSGGSVGRGISPSRRRRSKGKV